MNRVDSAIVNKQGFSLSLSRPRFEGDWLTTLLDIFHSGHGKYFPKLFSQFSKPSVLKVDECLRPTPSVCSVDSHGNDMENGDETTVSLSAQVRRRKSSRKMPPKGKLAKNKVKKKKEKSHPSDDQEILLQTE